MDTHIDVSGGSPEVGESLLAEDPTKLQADVTRTADALRSCDVLTFSLDPGITVELTVSPIQFDANSTIVRLDGTLSGHELNGYVSVENLGPAAMLFSYLQADDSSSQLASACEEQAVNKARNALDATHN